MKYKHLALGGTFDLLHRGHKQFLVSAFKYAEKITIGITSDSMVISKGKPPIDDFRKRRAIVVKFLKSKHFKNWHVIKLDNVFGIAADDKGIDAILVSSETRPAAVQINKVRVKAKLSPLKIISVGMVLAGDGKRISTGRIKEGEINRNGISFYKLLTKRNKHMMPQYLRTPLSRPLGKLYKDVEQFLGKNRRTKLFVVGDFSVAEFLKRGIIPNLSVVDFKIQRKKVYKKIQDLGFKKGSLYQMVNNNPGEITRDLTEAVYKNISDNNRIIKVGGEEDLAVLPVVLLTPLGSMVVYGQRGLGVVAIKVDEKSKEKFLSYLQQFE